MKLVALLLCGSFLFGQSAVPSPESKPQPPANSSSQTGRDQNSDPKSTGEAAVRVVSGVQQGNVDILSDTQGVDFRPYLKVFLVRVRENWYHLIPDCAQRMRGKLAIELSITKDGKLTDMKLVASSGSVALDRPAWGAITASSPFDPLPSAFTGPNLALRLRFAYNPPRANDSASPSDTTNPIDPDSSDAGCAPDDRGKFSSGIPAKSKSGITVSITAPVAGDTDVTLGGSKPVAAVATGGDVNEKGVEWHISGFGCSGVSCGEMIKDSYHAPSVMPSSRYVTVTAFSKVDPSAKASVTLHIVDPNPGH